MALSYTKIRVKLLLRFDSSLPFLYIIEKKSLEKVRFSFHLNNFWVSTPSSLYTILFIHKKGKTEKMKFPMVKFIVKWNCLGEREREKIKEIFHVRLVKKFEMKFSRFSSSSFIPHWLICKLSFPSFCFSYISFSLSHSHWVDIEQYCMTWENLLSSLVIRMWRSFYTQIKAKE